MTDDRFTLSWKNAEVVLHFLPNKLVVNLFANNVCVDQKIIAYDEVEATREYYPKFPMYEEAEKVRFTYGLQMHLKVTTIEEKNIEKRVEPDRYKGFDITLVSPCGVRKISGNEPNAEESSEFGFGEEENEDE